MELFVLLDCSICRRVRVCISYNKAMKPRNQYSQATADLYEEYVRNGLRYRYVAEALIEAAESIKGSTVVDLGCGTGILTRMLAERVGINGRVIGIDASAAMLASAKNTTPGTNSEFIQSAAEAIDKVIHQPVDAVFSSAAFWQFEREATLSALTKVIKPNGMLYFNLSAGFFDLRASGLAEPGDASRPFKQHDILAKWMRIARERYPEVDFKSNSGQPKKQLPQNSAELIDQLGRFGFEIQSITPLRFEIPRDDEYEWLKISQWTERLLSPLSYEKRIEILDEIFKGIPSDVSFLGRWVVVSARLKP